MDDNILKIAKAVISMIFGVEPKDVKSYFLGKGGVAVEYMSGDEMLRYKVELRENIVVWGIEDGRWRDHKLDSTITYRIIIDKLLISEHFRDDSKNINYFNLSDL